MIVVANKDEAIINPQMLKIVPVQGKDDMVRIVAFANNDWLHVDSEEMEREKAENMLAELINAMCDKPQKSNACIDFGGKVYECKSKEKKGLGLNLSAIKKFVNW